MEEINLNYKDEASLESGSGKDYTGKGSTGNRHYGSWGFFSMFLFFFYSHPLGMRWGGALFLPSLTCHPNAHSVPHSLVGLSLRVAPVGTLGS